MDSRALAEVRRLAERDAELAAAASAVRALEAEAEAVSRRAVEIGAFFASYPAEETRLRSETAHARIDHERREAELRLVAEEVAAARDAEERAAAERHAARAADRLAAAASRLSRAREGEAALEQTAASIAQELGDLEERARRVSEAVPDLPPSPSGPAELVDWASNARAHLFVQAGQLDTQRERVIREANELGTMLLGEPVYGATAAQVRRRVEAAA